MESRFYREWAEPLGMVDCLSTPLDKNENGTVFFGVFRHKDQDWSTPKCGGAGN